MPLEGITGRHWQAFELLEEACLEDDGVFIPGIIEPEVVEALESLEVLIVLGDELYTLTELGMAAGARLRAHKAFQGRYETFDPDLTFCEELVRAGKSLDLDDRGPWDKLLNDVMGRMDALEI